MKLTKRLLVIAAGLMAAFMFCSCARDSMNRMGNDMRDMARSGRNILDNGVNSIENGLERGVGTITGGAYGANSNYSGNAGTGTNTSLPYSGSATELQPTLRNKARSDMGYSRRSNAGQIDTNNGSTDGGGRLSENDR